MSTRWASGSIADVDVKDAGGRDCRIDILDGEALKGAIVGDSLLALDLTVHTQILDRSGVGVHFGVKIAQMPIGVLEDIIEAIDDAIGSAMTFAVTLSDSSGVDSIDMFCVPDFAALGGRVYQRGGMAAGYVKDVIFRFISVEPNV